MTNCKVCLGIGCADCNKESGFTKLAMLFIFTALVTTSVVCTVVYYTLLK